MHSGDVLVEPAPAAMRAALEAAPARVASWTVTLAGLDLRDVRREARRRITETDQDRPFVVTGHQPEFIHPGVWAKHVVASRLAEAVGGVAVNLTVDTDVAKTTALSVPMLTDGGLRVHAMQFADVAPGTTYEDIPPLDGAHVARLRESVRQALGERFGRSMMGPYLERFGSLDGPSSFVDQATAARSSLESEFGVRMLETRVSRSWICPLLVDILGNAPRLFESYNASLAEYRGAQGIRGSQRPIPDLIRDGDRLELPLWVRHTHEPRSRLFVEQRRDTLFLYADQQSVGCIGLDKLATWDRALKALRELDGVLFRPRALMLTLWARMLLADLFVHGIGGAKYDRITDRLIERYFGVQPPVMACVSATLRLDLPRHDATPDVLRALKHQQRDLTWNPQRHLSAGSGIDELVEARAKAVGQSRSLRATNGRRRAERREVFHQIRSISRRMLDLRPAAERDLEERVRQTTEGLRDNEAADRRDYFFALYERSALQRLCDTLPAVEEFRV